MCRSATIGIPPSLAGLRASGAQADDRSELASRGAGAVAGRCAPGVGEREHGALLGGRQLSDVRKVL